MKSFFNTGELRVEHTDSFLLLKSQIKVVANLVSFSSNMFLHSSDSFWKPFNADGGSLWHFY